MCGLFINSNNIQSDLFRAYALFFRWSAWFGPNKEIYYSNSGPKSNPIWWPYGAMYQNFLVSTYLVDDIAFWLIIIRRFIIINDVCIKKSDGLNNHSLNGKKMYLGISIEGRRR